MELEIEVKLPWWQINLHFLHIWVSGLKNSGLLHKRWYFSYDIGMAANKGPNNSTLKKMSVHFLSWSSLNRSSRGLTGCPHTAGDPGSPLLLCLPQCTFSKLQSKMGTAVLVIITIFWPVERGIMWNTQPVSCKYHFLAHPIDQNIITWHRELQEKLRNVHLSWSAIY